jgi:hypothetical protein
MIARFSHLLQEAVSTVLSTEAQQNNFHSTSCISADPIILQHCRVVKPMLILPYGTHVALPRYFILEVYLFSADTEGTEIIPFRGLNFEQAGTVCEKKHSSLQLGQLPLVGWCWMKGHWVPWLPGQGQLYSNEDKRMLMLMTSIVYPGMMWRGALVDGPFRGAWERPREGSEENTTDPHFTNNTWLHRYRIQTCHWISIMTTGQTNQFGTGQNIPFFSHQVLYYVMAGTGKPYQQKQGLNCGNYRWHWECHIAKVSTFGTYSRSQK